MESKILKSQKGITILEVVIVVFILALLFASVTLFVDPVGMRQKSRDSRRLSDISALERIISEYRVDNGQYPDVENILRQSNVLPDPSSISFNSSQAGWINEDFRNYNSILNADPVNDATYHYLYIHNTSSFELNAKLEKLTEPSLEDGGNDPDMYEVGNNLNLIAP